MHGPLNPAWYLQTLEMFFRHSTPEVETDCNDSINYYIDKEIKMVTRCKIEEDCWL